MYKYYDALLNRSGDALAGHFVRLFDAGGNQIDIFADESETPIVTESGTANAAKSDDDGMVRFYVASGEYDLRLYDATDTFVTSERAVPMIKGISEDALAEPSTAAAIGEVNEGNVQAALDAANASIAEKVPAADLASPTGGDMVGVADGATFQQAVAVAANAAALYASSAILTEGSMIRTADGLQWTVAASAASDYHAITASGAKLYVQPTADGTIDSAQFSSWALFETYAADLRAKKYIVRFPSTSASALVIADFVDCDMLWVGDVTATATIATGLIGVFTCERVRIVYQGTVDGASMAAYGISQTVCTDTDISGGFTVKNIASATAAIGVRFIGCTRSSFRQFVVTDVTGTISRGVYCGSTSTPSTGCFVEDYEIYNTVGTGSPFIDGDAIHVQQTVDASFWARRGKIGDFNWRAIKAQAPGVYIDDLQVADTHASNKNSVITQFYSNCSFTNIRGSAVQLAHVLEISYQGQEVGSIWRDINLSATGDNSAQANQYLFRAQPGTGGVSTLSGLEIGNVVVQGDSNYNRGLHCESTGTVQFAIRSGCIFDIPTGGVSRLQGVAGSIAQGTIFRHHTLLMRGTQTVADSLSGMDFLDIGSVRCTVINPVVDTNSLGNSRFDVTAAAQGNMIIGGNVLNVESVSTNPIAILIRSGAAGNRLVHLNWPRRNVANTKDVIISNLATAGANPIIDLMPSQANSTAATVGDLVTDFNNLLAKLRAGGGLGA